ncbi:cytochrome P450 4c3-like isoform X2 [Plodia interpunctella]|uniref:cytochrome P450 4c3-like isoform X2 n=1 Tax=Plodia interpunctella TaxID=58824 RepID=UPI002368E427|nr:cytochrome P450 4c3-like isoform X2 [Plodia interpunctella]
MISLLLVALLLVCAYCFTYIKERRARKMLAGLPSFSYLPFIGSMYNFIGGSEAIFHQLGNICKMTEDSGKPVVVWIGYNPALFLCDPEDVKVVTNAFIEKPFYYKFAKLWLGDGMLIASGPIWKRNFKKIISAGSFNTATVESYQDKFSSQAAKLVAQLAAEAGSPPFNVMDMLATNTLETICQPTFMEQYYHALQRTLTLLVQRGFNIPLHADFLYHLTPMYNEFKKHVAVLHKVTHTVMSQVNEQNKSLKKSDDNNINGQPRAKYKTYLENLLELQSCDPQFNWQQIQHEIHTIIVAGQETVATALFYILLMLGCQRTVQNNLYQELKGIFGDSKRPVTKEDLDRMPYCEAVINETLRLYPPAPAVIRYADRDLKIKSCTIPAGTACVVGVWGLGRSRRLWGPDALQYRPERWLDSACPGNSPAFSVFSYGRRACIGKKYAMSFLKTALAQCVRELELESEADKMRFKLDIALRPVNDYFIQVRRRDEHL